MASGYSQLLIQGVVELKSNNEAADAISFIATLISELSKIGQKLINIDRFS